MARAMTAPPDKSRDETIATLRPSPVRRVFALAMLAGAGLLLLWLAALRPPASPGWLVFLLAVAAAFLLAAWRVWRATAGGLRLTAAGLYDHAGRCLFALEEVRGVDRGAFAFKPSGGFLVHLARARGRAWAPGLWWRLGRRVGVGGVTRAAEARAMADLLVLHAARDSDESNR